MFLYQMISSWQVMGQVLTERALIMPIITVQAIAPSDPGRVAGLIEDVRLASAQALKCPSSNVWVIFQALDPGHYQRSSDVTVPSSMPTPHPPIVWISANEGRALIEREALVSAISEAVGRGLTIPAENVWVHYQEIKRCSVTFCNARRCRK